jgi:hypothetical protein
MKNMILTVAFINIALLVWGRDAFDGSFDFGISNVNDFGGGINFDVSLDNITVSSRLPMNTFIGGFFVYSDFVYVEIQEAFLFGGGNWKIEMGSPINQSQDIGKFIVFAIDLGIFFKYPYAITSQIIIFPLLGIDYQMTLFEKINDIISESPNEWNQLWFKLGGGIDYSFNELLYWRFETLYGIRLPTKVEIGDKLIGHGLTIKLAIGFSI